MPNIIFVIFKFCLGFFLEIKLRVFMIGWECGINSVNYCAGRIQYILYVICILTVVGENYPIRVSYVLTHYTD